MAFLRAIFKRLNSQQKRVIYNIYLGVFLWFSAFTTNMDCSQQKSLM